MDWPQIPRLGLGTFGRTGPKGLDAILTAIEIGYRHLDTAQTYDTEAVIGRAIERSGLPRSAFFIPTKVADTNLARKDSLPSLRGSLERLRTDRADLTLVHWPSYRDEVPFEEYMEELLQARADGLTSLANWRAAGLTLSPDELEAIDALDRNQRVINPDKAPAWD